MKYTQYIPIIGCALIILVAFAWYGQTLPTRNYQVELLPFPTKTITIHPNGSTSFIGSMRNVGTHPCRAELLTEHVTWNYSETIIQVNETVQVYFTITFFNETMNIDIQGIAL